MATIAPARVAIADSYLPIQTTLVALSREETDDAIAVLTGAHGGSLNASQISSLQEAQGFLDDAVAATTLADRQQAIADAITRFESADAGIANIEFNLGDGTLMF